MSGTPIYAGLIVVVTVAVMVTGAEPSMSPGTLLDAFKYFRKSSTRSLPIPMEDNVSMDLINSLDARRVALAACPSPQLKRLADLQMQWWTPLSCHLGRHVTRVYVPDAQRSTVSQRFVLMQALNRSANFAATTGRKFGDAVSKFMGYRDFEQWTSNWGDTAHLPCLPSPDSDKYLDNFRHISRTGELKSLAMFWHGNLQSYFLFFTMAGMHRDTASEFTEDAREYSCRLYDVLDMVRNLLVQMEMKTEFKLLQPPPSECMQSACKFNVDPFHRLAISLRDSVSLLSDVRRRIDDFRLYYDDDRDASTDTTRS